MADLIKKNLLFFSHVYQNDSFEKDVAEYGKRFPGVAISNYEAGFLASICLISNMTVSRINRPFLPYIKDFENKEEYPKPFFSKLVTKKYQDVYYYKHIKSSKIVVEKIRQSDYIVFSTYHDWRLFKLVKKINPKTKSILLLPDLPNFIVNKKTSFKHRLLRQHLAKRFMKSLSYIDGLIPITEGMGAYLNNRVQKQLQIESVAKDEDIQNKDRSSFKKQIVYCGGLSKSYGVLELVKAFNKCDLSSSYKLVICGKGEAEEEIKELAKNNENVLFLGFIPRQDVLDLLSSSAFLIVPESPKNEYSKYSFHSKIIECLGSATPTIAYMYEGIPKDYAPYILKIEGKGEDVEKEITHALNTYLKLLKDDNISFGTRAKDFIKGRNSKESVSIKIERFLSEL